MWLMCPACNHVWDWQGTIRRANCPFCGSSISPSLNNVMEIRRILKELINYEKDERWEFLDDSTITYKKLAEIIQRNNRVVTRNLIKRLLDAGILKTKVITLHAGEQEVDFLVYSINKESAKLVLNLIEEKLEEAKLNGRRRRVWTA